MNDVTFKDLLDNIDDYCQNFDVTSIDKGNKKRQANRAFENVQRKLGLPSDKRTFDFFYYQDQQFYDVPPAFNEFIQLYYKDASFSQNSFPTSGLNIPARRWNLMRDTEILRSSGGYPTSNRLAFSTQNGGVPQLLLSGRNVVAPVVVNPFQTLTGLTFSSDASNISVDSNVKINGYGSVKFDLDASLSASTITMASVLNIQNYINNNSAYRLFIDFPIGSTFYFSTVEMRFITSPGNYFTVSTATQVDGSVWSENSWSLLSFPFNNLTTVGTPSSTNITSVEIVLNHSGLFQAFTNLRLGELYQVNPDLLVCSYWSAYKGTDSTGGVEKILLTEDSDICSFGNIAPDLIDPIAIKAALRLFPQLRGDISFWQMYKADYDETMKQLGKTYPRGRTTGSAGATEILR